MGLWGYGFTRESTKSRAHRRYGAFYLCSMFILPSFIWYCFGNPAVTGWFIKRMIPINYPPESDPRVISRIYHDKGTNGKDSV